MLFMGGNFPRLFNRVKLSIVGTYVDGPISNDRRSRNPVTRMDFPELCSRDCIKGVEVAVVTPCIEGLA